MEKKANETFREYAHKWRDLAAQVQPPLIDKELNKIFFNTLKAPYYDRMIGNSNKDFSDVVSVREMIKNGVKLKKIKKYKDQEISPQEKERRDTCSVVPKKSLQSLLSTTTKLWLSAL